MSSAPARGLQPALPRRSAVWMLLVCAFPALLASEAAAQQTFVPPQPFPEEKYENGWRKNPFTLKTAPVAIQRESFSKNLALGSMYDDAEGVTCVVVVNTKTRERTRLKGQEPAANGMRVTESVIADTRRDSYAVIVSGGEKATLRYDTAFLKQMAAGQGGGATTQTPPHGMGQKQPSNGAAPDPATAGMNMTNMDQDQSGAPQPPPGAYGQPPPQGANTGMMNGGGAPTPVPPGIRPLPGQPPNMGAGRPNIPSRRRLTVPPQSPPPPVQPVQENP
jgi:hypothetical protein